MKFEISTEELNLIVNVLRYVDPSGFFASNTARNLIRQFKDAQSQQVRAMQDAKDAKDGISAEDSKMIKKLEQEIGRESIQPSGFLGQK